jgi:hypothetical protein
LDHLLRIGLDSDSSFERIKVSNNVPPTGAPRNMSQTVTAPLTITPVVSAAPRTFHTLLVFRCPTELSEALAAHAAKHGSTNLSAAIRDLLRVALQST